MAPEDPGAPRPGPVQGETIGGFRLVRRLGAGGMGVVHAAWDDGLQRDVALKVLAPHLSADEEFRRRFAREARTQGGLDSAHVLPVYATGEDDGRLWIATALVPDGDLGALLAERGPMPVPLAVDLVLQVVDGLADAHAAGLVHRDIKPGNVLVRRRGRDLHAYLADFGVARSADERFTRTGVLVGSPQWMAPELHRGAVADTSSDVYAVGLLLWTVLLGSPPWTGTDYEVARGHVEGPVPRLAGEGPVVEALNRVLGRCLAKAPADRYADVAALREDLAAAQWAARVDGDATVAPRDAGSATRPPTPRRRRTALVAVLGVALVVLAVVTGWLLWPSSDPGGEAGPSGSSSTAATAPTSPDPTAGGEDPERRQRAIDNLTTAFATQMASEESARCTAEKWVDDIGVDRLVANDALDEDLQPTDTDVSEYESDVRASLTFAGLSCASP